MRNSAALPALIHISVKEEENAISSRLVVLSYFPQTVPFTAVPHCLSSLGLIPGPRAQAAQLPCSRLGLGLVRPETIGGHEAVCKTPTQPVC
ncbi:hypothetical protein PBY51_011574 [Eleginops maclovinus]|uniref:Uncharacterized protein n=1 Tax=Eleginops maclovinus TaxID=56733 RepID=A0AAN7XW45_ELEMC|nr:hypothetical protein PBY51_011574 [Eleginops maclovinus]